MNRERRCIALMLDLQRPDKRHAEIYAVIQRSAEERGRVTVIDEFAHDNLVVLSAVRAGGTRSGGERPPRARPD